MKIVVLSLLFICSAVAGLYHLPELRLYIPMVDTGYEQYNTPTLHFTSKYVLTFDDGPHPIHTAKILDILKEYNVKATFFVLTHKLNQKNLPLIKRILDEGHIVSSHDHIHDHNNKIDRETFKKKMTISFLKLKEFYEKAGHKMTTFYFRFPYAEYGGRSDYHHINVMKEVSQELFGDNCIHFAFWDIDSGDWIPKLTAQEVSKNIIAHHTGGEYTTYKIARNSLGQRRILKKKAYIDSPTEGGVILQHDIQKRSVEGTRHFLNYAKKNSIKIVPLNTVEEFSYDGLNCSFL
jgi:peptidoglycan/xylan/chitin deacetylase (PgdA/CDA1 family)